MAYMKRKLEDRLEGILNDYKNGYSVKALSYKYRIKQLEVYNILMDHRNEMGLDQSYEG